MAKRLFDLLLAGAGVVCLAPVLILVGILVRLDSKGPALYRGVRSGRHGRPFRMLKFRTMVVGAEQLGGGSTGKDDPRVTRLGRLLRRYKIDELPQLLNVLKGEMSIVGPRPELPQYTSQYTGEEEIILTVLPGITDLASMEFARLDEVLGDSDPDRVYEDHVRPVKNALRVKYVSEQSFLGDLAIIFKTLRKVVWG